MVSVIISAVAAQQTKRGIAANGLTGRNTARSRCSTGELRKTQATPQGTPDEREHVFLYVAGTLKDDQATFDPEGSSAAGYSI